MPAGYADAGAALGAAHRTARAAHDVLFDALAGCAYMAGDDATSEGWVAAYDPAAAAAMLGIADLAVAWGNLAIAAVLSGANHEDADAGSTLGRSGYVGYSGEAPGAPVGVPGGDPEPFVAGIPTTALGSDDTSMPETWSLVVDHLQGWAWPSANLDSLGAAADAWNHAADLVEASRYDGAAARLRLETQHSPEIPTAVRAVQQTEDAATDLAGVCRDLATACTEYAANVQGTRDVVEGLLRELAVEAAATAAAAAIAAFFTLGGSAAAGTAVILARAAACARRVIAALVGLRALHAASTVYRTVDRLTDLRRILSRFKNLSRVRRRPRVPDVPDRPGRPGVARHRTDAGGRDAREPGRGPSSDASAPATDTARTTPNGTPVPDHVTGPDGVQFPGVPQGAEPIRVAENGRGAVYDVRDVDGLHPSITELRVMDPKTTGTYQYPDGYVVYYRGEQAVHPLTGQTVGKTSPFRHIPLPKN